MKRALAPLTLGLALAGSAGADTTIGRMVHVDVGVFSATGLPVTGLGAADFEILSDGEPVPIAEFVPGPRPLNIVLLIDVSASMQSAAGSRDLVKGLKERFIDALAAMDRVRIGSFARDVSISPAFTSNTRDLKRSLDRALETPGDTEGPSRLWDALHTAIGELARVEGRRVVLLVSDGRATGNRFGVQEVAEYAAATDVLVNVAGGARERLIRQSETEAVVVRAGVAMRWVADVTGGIDVRQPSAASPPGSGFAAALETLRQMYRLGFTAPLSDGRFHSLEVRVKRTEGTVRARQAYLAHAGTS